MKSSPATPRLFCGLNGLRLGPTINEAYDLIVSIASREREDVARRRSAPPGSRSVRHSSGVDFDTVADELYGLPPETFTAARNDRAKQARVVGDRALADRITSLRKPTMAAWLTNQLARSHADQVALLLDLGTELRDVLADVDGEEMRELTRQRYQLVSALVQQARSLAQATGRRVTDEAALAVQSTLEATLSDAASAKAVAAGRLDDALQVSGFGAAGVEDRPRRRDKPLGSAKASRTTATSAGSGGSGRGAVVDLAAQRQRRQREQAEREVDVADRAAKRATVEGERAQERLQVALRKHDEASAAVDRLRHELEAGVEALDRHEQQAQQAREGNDEAKRRARDADDELADARARLQDLAP